MRYEFWLVLDDSGLFARSCTFACSTTRRFLMPKWQDLACYWSCRAACLSAYSRPLCWPARSWTPPFSDLWRARKEWQFMTIDGFPGSSLIALIQSSTSVLLFPSLVWASSSAVVWRLSTVSQYWLRQAAAGEKKSSECSGRWACLCSLVLASGGRM